MVSHRWTGWAQSRPLIADGGSQTLGFQDGSHSMGTSAHQRRPSFRRGSTHGHDHELLVSTVLVACAPPFMMFIVRDGQAVAVHAAQEAVQGMSSEVAAAKRQA